MMTEEQARLVLAILSCLDWDIVQGDGAARICKYCGGCVEGYWGFEHKQDCIVPLIEQLRSTLDAEERMG